MAKFKVGDKARYIGGPYVINIIFLCFIGSETTILGFEEDFDGEWVVIDMPLPNQFREKKVLCRASELEPLQKRPELGSWEADVFVKLGWNPNKKKEPVHG